MPIQRCKSEGRLGWKFGKSGRCYIGSGAKARARRQERAIRASGWTENISGVLSNVGGVHLAGESPALPTLEVEEQNDGISEGQELGGTSAVSEGSSGYVEKCSRPRTESQSIDRSPSGAERIKQEIRTDAGRNGTPARCIRRNSGGSNGRNGAAQQDLGTFTKTTANASSQTASGSNSDADETKSRRYPNPLRIDPTRTTTLRRTFLSEARKRLNLLKQDVRKLVIEDDVFGLKVSKPFMANTRFSFLSVPQQIEEFRRWIDVRAQYRLLGSQENPWWNKYIDKAYRKGAGKIFDDVNASKRISSLVSNESFIGRKLQFLSVLLRRFKTVQKLKVLSSRMFSGIRGIKDALVARMVRNVTDGLEQRQSPSAIARALTKSIDAEFNATNKVIQTETTRMYVSGQLGALKELDVEKVSVFAELRTAGDDFVCSVCSSNEGQVFTVEEAEGIIPVHPFCRCRYVLA